jgi:hypothetical protein
VPVPLLTWDPFKDRLWYVPAGALTLREHLASTLVERSLWPSHITFTLDSGAPYDLAFFPSVAPLEASLSPATIERLVYEAAGRQIVTVMRPHRFPSLMVYYF